MSRRPRPNGEQLRYLETRITRDAADFAAALGAAIHAVAAICVIRSEPD